MNLGLHVSIAGSIDKAVDNAVASNCTAFQMFTRKPRQWITKELSDDEVSAFRTKLESSKIDKYAVCAHMPYFLNLASPEEAFYKQSLNTLVEEVKRCGMLGVQYLVIHLGNHMGAGTEVGIKNVVNACNTAIERVNNDVTILLENTAGTKDGIGSSFEEIRKILDRLETKTRFGVCLDTCHAFSAGYDLRTDESVHKTIDEFDKIIGLKELKIVHLNDSRGDLDSKMDAHEHIGMGFIREKGFAAIVTNEALKGTPLIMETPIDNRRDDEGNMKKVMELAATI